MLFGAIIINAEIFTTRLTMYPLMHVLRLGCTGMHYVTYTSHRMQKHKSIVTYPNMFLWKPHGAHRSMKNSVSTFNAFHALECTT
jgi:hypothetical protein